LMMTDPKVRVTLKLSDDGTFGKCRNLERVDWIELKSKLLSFWYSFVQR